MPVLNWYGRFNYVAYHCNSNFSTNSTSDLNKFIVKVILILQIELSL
jgi:hypothetical protein